MLKMGNRLSKIYTKTGDGGTTGLGDGGRLSKADLRFWAMGEVDELNAHIGLLLAQLTTARYETQDFCWQLTHIQHKLFDIGGEIALPNHQDIGYVAIGDEHIAMIERWIDDYNGDLPYLKEFILPAGSPQVAQTHIARCVCRRAERRLVALVGRDKNISANVLKYINRLSDFLFVLARTIGKRDGIGEVFWQKN